nr:DEP domain-containing protein 7-like isoform X1 [Labrus bergylta]
MHHMYIHSLSINNIPLGADCRSSTRVHMASIKDRAAALNLTSKMFGRPQAHGDSRKPVCNIWRGLISHLRSSVTVKRQRVHFKSHSDCFLGSEAADAVEEHIHNVKGFQGACVSRDKVVSVCQALLDHNVFETVGNKVFGKDKRTTLFQDSKSAFYRFAAVCTQSIDDLERGWPLDEIQKLFCITFSERQEDQACPPGTHVQVTTKTFTKANQLDTAGLSVEPLLDTTGLSSGKVRTDSLPQSLLDDIWKEQTIQKLLNLVELPLLEGVLQCIQDPSSTPSNLLIHKNTDLINSSNHLDRQILKAFRDSQDDEWLCAALDCLVFLPDQPVVKLSRDLPHCFPLDCCDQLPAPNSLQDKVHNTDEQPRLSPSCLDQCKLLLYWTLVTHYSHRPPLLPEHMTDIYMAIIDLLVNSKIAVALEALQLCLKLLPLTCREELHKLLTFAALAADPQGIKLDKKMDNRLAVMKSFSGAVLRCKALSKETDDLMVVFMLSNVKDIFKIPGALHRGVSDQLSFLVEGKKPNRNGSSFCQQVSRKTYNDEKTKNTNQELWALIKSIHLDNTISTKKRKHLLGQFSQAHPQIFHQYFCESAVDLP